MSDGGMPLLKLHDGMGIFTCSHFPLFILAMFRVGIVIHTFIHSAHLGTPLKLTIAPEK